MTVAEVVAEIIDVLKEVARVARTTEMTTFSSDALAFTFACDTTEKLRKVGNRTIADLLGMTAELILRRKGERQADMDTRGGVGA